MNDVIVFFVSIPPRKVSRLVPDRTCRAQPWGVSIPPRKVSRSFFRSSVSSSGAGFHSTKEGFKVAHLAFLFHSSSPFPFHQGRFQGVECVVLSPDESQFPFHQGRFQGGAANGSAGHRRHVSIPPRKVSRTPPDGGETRIDLCFHSTKEGFKDKSAAFCNSNLHVSIPPRKVSRASNPARTSFDIPVSIPPRKVSRYVTSLDNLSHGGRFHSTKEGFKVTL